ncbi:MAG: L,D-transpeptidase family protein [Spirochaetota bacterium]
MGLDEPARFREYRYYPGPFPEGEWTITSAGSSPNPMIGEYLRTDATIDVQTYTEASGGFEEGPVRYDEDGFLIHGGGYTSNDLFDPTGNNRWEDNTLGCLRLRNADMDELAGYARRALDSGGAATIRVDRED